MECGDGRDGIMIKNTYSIFTLIIRKTVVLVLVHVRARAVK